MKKMLLTSDLKQVLARTQFLFEKPFHQMTFIYITTATNVYADEDKGWFFEERRALQNLGVELIEFDIRGKSKECVVESIKDTDAVCVAGGNTYYLLEHMNKCDFKSVIVPFLNAGGFYIGSSAGSVVTCPTIDFIGEMDDPKEATLTDYKGLGLVPFNIMPHTNHPGFSRVAKKMMQEQSDTPMIGLRDDQALFVDGHCIEII